tara:strand:+ start:849 stop:1109 length:261 start_codon:yes stop_codon:yes gene_type:complete
MRGINSSYITVKTTQIDTVDFSQLIGTRADLKYSIDKSEFVTKWEFGAPYMPSSIEAVPEADRSAILTHTQAVALMQTSAWTTPID